MTFHQLSFSFSSSGYFPRMIGPWFPEALCLSLVGPLEQNSTDWVASKQ